MRLFIALDVPDAWREAARDALDALPAEARAALRAVPAERLHVTLRFIGEYPEGGVTRLEQALDEQVGAVDLQMALGRAGTFGRSVVWLGVEGDGLAGLVARVEQAVRAAGVAASEERFSGHLTIARTRGRMDARQWNALDAAVRALPAPPRSPVHVRSVVLFESASEGGALVYRALHRTVG
ncbi:MAG: RNA 2',3'-cyclic phosphodiesterase [Dehalococcoidia bacterium]|nr:MAG: RNA 2',3'-cyclic phosphodiesterase [Dehalococcoidia bacterium]